MKKNNAKNSFGITILLCFFLIVFQSNLTVAEEKKVLANIYYFDYAKAIDFIKIYNTGEAEVYIPDNNGDGGSFKTVKLPKKKLKKLFTKIKKTGITDTEEKSRGFVSVDLPFYAIDVVIDGSLYMLGSEHPRFTKENYVVTQTGLHILKEYETKETYFQDNATAEYKNFRTVWDRCFTKLDAVYLEITGTRILDAMNRYLNPIDKEPDPAWQRFLNWLESEDKRLNPERAGQNRHEIEGEALLE